MQHNPPTAPLPSEPLARPRPIPQAAENPRPGPVEPAPVGGEPSDNAPQISQDPRGPRSVGADRKLSHF
jgi:hypothetical protein